MAIHILRETELIPISQAEAWDFFSRPENLKTITPPGIGFDIQGNPPEKIYPGLMITYIVKPLFGIPLTWVTEISHVREGEYFVDEQRIGPYKIWHHEHHFAAKGASTEVTDIVTYALPFGILGKIAHAIIVKPRLRAIFDFRREKIRSLFPSK
ncbi:MAG TPA: SRPBCC family protein [Leptospiraceae bacterium]|nr:SRPBCC family protein [Leptospirales bacterium]HMU83357.1 SRPBCC family protein [Leptospiraceae bacterium]HMW59036.1 SRPBCC family protein [Leptospiraceae bacterium]HMX55060.1 SRPBCC family protein [Leptospiraceae bacterium]HNE25089.1 SRPBCC family protein [Leptospiraceae bacterium]